MAYTFKPEYDLKGRWKTIGYISQVEAFRVDVY